MNRKRVFMCIVSTIMTTALIASLFFDERTRAAILFGVLCLGFIPYHITGFLLIHEMDKDRPMTIDQVCKEFRISDIGAAVMYGISGEWKKVIYWLAAAVLNAAVTF